MKVSLAGWLMMAMPLTAAAGPWYSDYAEALQAAKQQDKPLFIDFTSAKTTNVSADRFARIGDLTDNFVLLRANKNTPAGAKLFKMFEIDGDNGAVVVEREQKWQYSRYQRDLNQDELTTLLTKTSTAKGKPNGGDVLQPVSESQSVSSPVFYGGSGYCPNCRR